MANGQIRYTVDFDVNQQKLKELKAQLQSIKDMKIGDIMNTSGLNRNDSVEALKNIKTQAINVENALEKAFNPKLNTINIKEFQNQLSKSGTSIEKIRTAFVAAGAQGQSAFNKMASQILGVNVRMRETNTILDKMATTLGNSIKWNVASSAINGVTRGIQQAWGFTKALDSSLNDIRIVTGKSADEMARFSVQANETAKNLGKTTTDFTNAALIYAQQGLGEEDVQQRARLTLMTANVTGQDAKDVSEELTAVWNGYKVSAEQAEVYIDRLAAIAATTASNLEELSTGMSKVASAAAAMGVGEDQLAAQLSTIISATRQAPQSVGTALRTVYARISDIKAGIDEDGVSLGNYSGKMAALGINVLDMNGRLRDMGEVIEQIGGKWQNLTREQQVNLAQIMAGQRQYNNLLALFDNFDKYSSAMQTAANAQGTLSKQQDIYMDRTTAKLNQLKAVTQGLYISLTDTDSINNIIIGLTRLADLTNNFVQALGGGQGVLLNLGAIGFSVFNQQLANGVNNFIQRLTEAKMQQDELKTKIQQAKELSLTASSPELAGQYSQRASYLQQFQNRSMSAKDFETLQRLNDETISVIGKMGQASESVRLLENQIKKLGGSDSEDSFQKIKSNLLQLQQQTKRSGEQFNSLYKTIIGKKYSDKDAFNQDRQSILDSITGFQSTGAGSSLNSSYQQQIENIKKTLGQIEFKPNIDSSVFTAQLGQLMGIAKGHINQLELAIKNATPEQLEELKEKLRQAKQQYDNLTEAQKTFQTSVNFKNLTQNITNLASALTSIVALSNNFKRFFEIGDDKNLSNVEKRVQQISAIGMAIPLAFMAAQKIVPILAGLPGVLANIGTAATAAGGGIASFGAALMAIPHVAVVAAVIMAGAAVFGHYRAQAQKARKQLEEFQNTAKENIQTSKNTIEQIRHNEELYNSLIQLSKEIKQSGLTRSEVKSKIQDLCDQYGLEEDKVQSLINSYNDLGSVVREEKLKDLQKETKASNDRVKNAEDLLNSNLNNNNFEFNDSVFGLNYGQSDRYNNIDKVIASSLGVDTKYYTNLSNFANNIKNIQIPTGKQFIDFYQQQEKTVIQLEKKYSQAELKNYGLYNQLKQFLQNNKENVNQLIEAYKQQDQIQTAKQVLSEGFGAIQSLPQFIKQRAEILKGKDESAINAFNDALGYYGDQFLQANSIAKWQDKIKKQFNLENDPRFIQGLQQLTEQQQNALMSVDITKFKSIDDLLNYINNYISKINSFDEIDYTKLDLDAIIDYASDIYVKYQEIEDKIKSGKNLSKKEFGELIPELQEYFTQLANGTYKLTGDAQEFYKIVDQYKFQDYNQAYQVSQAKIDYASRIQNGLINYDFNELSQSAYSQQQQGIKYGLIDHSRKDTLEESDDLLAKQLKYLDSIAAQGSILDQNIELWKQHREQMTLTQEEADAIAEAIKDIGNLSEISLGQLTQEQRQLLKTMAQAQNPLDSDIDESKYNNLSNKYFDELKQKAGDSEEALEIARDAADHLAEEVLRLDDAITDVTKNYDKWNNALKGGNEVEKLEAVEQLRDAYADMLNIDGSILSDSFLNDLKNLQLMKQAANGSQEAWYNLRDAMQQDLIAQVGLDATNFINGVNSLINTQIPKFDDKSINVDANLNTDNFINSLNDLIVKSGMSADQVRAALLSMGVDAEVVEVPPQPKKIKQIRKQFVPAQYTATPIQGPNGQVLGANLEQVGEGAHFIDVQGGEQEYVQPGTAAIRVVSASRSGGGRSSAGGNVSFSKLRNANGSIGSANSGGGKKSGGGGGGGGGKTYKPKDKKDLDKSKDHRYHDINQELEKSNELLDSLSKKQSRLSGQAFITNLNQQIKLIEQQIELTKEKINLQKEDLSERKEELAKLGVIFDGDTIANYQAIINARQAEYNALLTEQNALIEQANAAQSDSFDAEIEAKDKQAQNSKKALDEAKKQMDEYEALQKQMREEEAKIEEERQKIIEKQIQKFHYAIQIHLELSEAEKEWNEFKRKVLGKTTVDVLMRTDYSEGMDSLNISAANYQTEANKINQLQAHLRDIRDEISIMEDGGTSDIYGDNLKQAYEDLKRYNDQLTKSLGNLQEEIKNAQAAFENIMNYIDEKFKQYGDDLDFISDSIEHNMELLKLLYGEDNYDVMAKYYEKLKQNQLKSVENSRTAVDFWYNEWQKAIERQDEEGAEKAKERWKNSLKELQSDIQTSAKTIRQEYENAIDGVFDKLEKKMTNGKGFDFLNLEWDLIKDQDDRFLDTVNSAFGLQDLESEFNKAINDAAGTALKGQKALAKLRDEELKKLKEKDKLTQYDLDRAKQRLQVEQARIALEEAQQNKSTMRLRRDSQGNYRYEYVADQNQVLEAQQNYAKAQNDLYNLDKNRRRDLLDETISTAKEMNEKLAEAEKIRDPEERERQRQLITEKYNQKLVDLTSQLSENEKNLMHSAFEAMGIDLQTLSDTQANVMMEQMVPTWNNGVSEMAKTMLSSEEGLLPLCQQAFTQLDGITKNYEESLKQLSEKGGEDLEKIKEGATDIADEFEKEVIPKDEEVIGQLGRMALDADGVYNNFIKLAQGLEPATLEAGRLADEIYRAWKNAKKLDAIVDLDDDGGFETSRTNYSDDADVPQTEAVAPVYNNSGSGGGSGSSGGRYSPSGTPQTPPENPPKTETDKNLLPWEYYPQGGGKLYTKFKDGQLKDPTKVISYKQLFTGTNNIGTEVATDLEGNKIYQYKLDGKYYWSLEKWLTSRKYKSYDTGGYTGEWADQSGKFAMLHQKELVLNAQDTKNFLGGISILRDIVKNIGHNLYEKMSNINSAKSLKNLVSSEKSIQQTVHIQASFPNVDSKREIQEALSDLVNLAAQRAMNKK